MLPLTALPDIDVSSHSYLIALQAEEVLRSIGCSTTGCRSCCQWRHRSNIGRHGHRCRWGSGCGIVLCSTDAAGISQSAIAGTNIRIVDTGRWSCFCGQIVRNFVGTPFASLCNALCGFHRLWQPLQRPCHALKQRALEHRLRARLQLLGLGPIWLRRLSNHVFSVVVCVCARVCMCERNLKKLFRVFCRKGVMNYLLVPGSQGSRKPWGGWAPEFCTF